MILQMNEYQKQAQRTSNTIHARDKLLNGLLGLCGEAGEAIDLYKKFRYQGHPLNKAELVKELGDILWYVAEAATGLGVTLEYVGIKNIEKLRDRYPNGFRSFDSMNRKEYKSEEQSNNENTEDNAEGIEGAGEEQRERTTAR